MEIPDKIWLQYDGTGWDNVYFEPPFEKQEETDIEYIRVDIVKGIIDGTSWLMHGDDGAQSALEQIVEKLGLDEP